VIAVATFVAALGTAACAAAESLPVLGALRLASGATAGAIIPLAIAHIGDIVPYERRQPVLARFISGQMFGIVFGQAFGGALIEHVGWRGIFLVLGAGYLAIAALLLRELRSAAGVTQVRRRASGGLLAAYLGVVRIQWVRVLVSIVFAEGFLLYGGAAYFGAYLRHDFGLGYTLIGGLLACFGIGALIYSATAPFVIARLGETGLVLAGGALMAASYWASALLPAWQVFAPVIALTGAGFYMMHNTLQTNGTQMAPHARADLEAFVRAAPRACQEAFAFTFDGERVTSFTDRMILLRADRD
jgi:predicted MFS family arabinose efflux permease